jgi:hypothetical protein
MHASGCKILRRILWIVFFVELSAVAPFQICVFLPIHPRVIELFESTDDQINTALNL